MENKNDEFVIIENWSKGLYFGKVVLLGNVQNHPKHEKGKYVTTSPIIEVNSKEEYIQTKTGTRYKLGKVDEKYEEQFPNARERIFGIS